MTKENWTDIHENFDEVNQLWKGQGFTLPKVQQWIKAGLKTSEHEWTSYLKSTKFTPQKYAKFKSKKAQKWIDFFTH